MNKKVTAAGLLITMWIGAVYLLNRLTALHPETDEEIANTMSRMEKWGEQQSIPLFLSMTREDGDPNKKPWDVFISRVDRNGYEWDEIGYPRLDMAVEQAERDYRDYPTGHERKYRDR